MSKPFVFLFFKSLFEDGNSVRNSLFKGFLTVLINFGFILFTVCKAAGTAYASADTSHALNEVRVKHIPALFKERRAAGFYSLTRKRLILKVCNSLLQKTLSDSVRKTAASSKNSAEVRSVIKYILVKRHYVDIFTVKKRL